ncbi:LOW QUALITY PROTEIN: Cobalamin biosynthesis protein CobW [Phytophthora palmivora]|uniref:Cobalamin biosynthesis protein CobW n=1 Tax=Phytophthora palmivora TaxID=4796 RepID=A0A2P4X222_9STRA|nr:LOW QUALITY PROTEIN: Cobalamin biosynthesis protein CobW [Phytophthora palmivora]
MSATEGVSLGFHPLRTRATFLSSRGVLKTQNLCWFEAYPRILNRRSTELLADHPHLRAGLRLCGMNVKLSCSTLRPAPPLVSRSDLPMFGAVNQYRVKQSMVWRAMEADSAVMRTGFLASQERLQACEAGKLGSHRGQHPYEKKTLSADIVMCCSET